MRYGDFRELLELEGKYPSLHQAIIESLTSIRRLKPVKVGEYYLSIQASHYFDCEPRETVDIYQYKSMEIAILQDTDSYGGYKYVNPVEDNILKGFPRYEELCGYYQDEKNYGSFVPVDLIQDLYEYLKGYEQAKQALEVLSNIITEICKVYVEVLSNIITEICKVYVEFLKAISNSLSEIVDIDKIVKTIENQEEQIEALLEELEEYEEEIEDLEELVEKQGKALRDKDKFIEQLERVIENQKNTSKLYKVLDYIDVDGLEDMGLSFCMRSDKEGNVIIFLSEEVMGMNEIFDYEV